VTGCDGRGSPPLRTTHDAERPEVGIHIEQAIQAAPGMDEVAVEDAIATVGAS
jgi:hypothetical protein